MKKMFVISLALIALGASPAPGQKSSSRAGAISGRIVTDDGQPIVKATVRISAVRTTAGVGRVVGVEEDGRFEAADLAPGLYRVFVNAPGYANPVSSAERKFYRPGDFITIKLVRGGVVTGAVSAFTGEPVVAAPVRAIRVRDEEGRPLRFPSGSQTVQTDDRGVYRLYGLLAGYYLIAAGSGSFFSPLQFSDYTEHAPTYYPSSTRDTAAEVAVRGAQEVTGVDIRYRAERGYSISGTVTGNIPPSTMGGASVTLRQVSGGVGQSVQIVQGEVRSFAVHGLADGEYEITARSFRQNGEGDISPARRVTIKGADVTGVELALAPLGSISGRIVLEAPPSACKKDRTPRLEEIALIAVEDRGKGEGVRQSSDTAPDEKGEFTLRSLEAASYRIDFNLPDVWYVRSMSLPSPAKKTADALTGVSIKSGEKATGLLVAVAEGAASLSGRIVTEKENDSLPSRTRLHLVPADKELFDNPLRYAEAIVKNDGLFAFANIAPGRYKLLARAIAEDEIFSDARPAAWDSQSRRKLRAEAEATAAVIELKPCQKMVDYALRFSPTVRKID